MMDSQAACGALTGIQKISRTVEKYYSKNYTVLLLRSSVAQWLKSSGMKIGIQRGGGLNPHWGGLA